MKKEKKTPEEISFNRKFAGFKRTIKSNIELNGGIQGGVRKMELEIEFFKQHPNNPLPKKALNHEQTVRAMEEALAEFKEDFA